MSLFEEAQRAILKEGKIEETIPESNIKPGLIIERIGYIITFNSKHENKLKYNSKIYFSRTGLHAYSCILDTNGFFLKKILSH